MYIILCTCLNTKLTVKHFSLRTNAVKIMLLKPFIVQCRERTQKRIRIIKPASLYTRIVFETVL